MSKLALALALLASIFPLARLEGAAAPSAAAALRAVPGEWIYVGRREDPDTGDIVYIWEWSEYYLRHQTYTKVPPPPPAIDELTQRG